MKPTWLPGQRLVRGCSSLRFYFRRVVKLELFAGRQAIPIHSREFRLLVRTFALVVLVHICLGNLIPDRLCFLLRTQRRLIRFILCFHQLFAFARANPAAVVPCICYLVSKKTRGSCVDAPCARGAIEPPVAHRYGMSLVGLAVLFSDLFRYSIDRAACMGAGRPGCGPYLGWR